MIRPPAQPFWPSPHPYSGTTLNPGPDLFAGAFAGAAVLIVVLALAGIALFAALWLDKRLAEPER